MIRSIYCLLLVCLPFLFSCEMKRDLLGGGSDEAEKEKEVLEKSGLLDLEIKAEKEAALPGTKGDGDDSLNDDEFAISILDSLGQLVKYYESYADMRKDGGLLLPIGRYTVKASLGEDVTAGYDMPYYAGDTACFISGKEVSKVVTECKLSNKKVTFQPTGNFEKSFKDDYTIVLDNGLGVLTTTKDDSRTTYLRNTGSLSFVLYVTTQDNKPHIYTVDLSSSDSIQSYNNVLIVLDVPEQSGGDPSEPEEPDDPNNPGEPEEPDDPEPLPDPEYPVATPTIKVDVSLIEKDYIIEIPSDFISGETPNEPEEPENPGGNDNPDSTAPSIKGVGFDMSTALSIPLSNPNRNVVVSVNTPKGLKSLLVTIDSKVLEPALIGLKLGKSFDMLDKTKESILKDIGLSIPESGDTSTNFDISTFIPMIAGLNSSPDTYKFTIQAVDNEGKKDTKTLTIKMTK